MDSFTEKSKAGFDNFSDFYPYYLEEHSNVMCRRLHFLGSTLVLVILGYVIYSGQLAFLFAVPVAGYGCAWLGHFLFEANKPAAFRHPFYSLMGDWVMYKDILMRKVSL